MPTQTARRTDGKGRGPQERASFALGSDLLDRLSERGERSGTNNTQQVRFLVEMLLEGRLLMIGGMGDIVALLPLGGCSKPLARTEWAPTADKQLPLINTRDLQGPAAAGDAGRRSEPAPRR